MSTTSTSSLSGAPKTAGTAITCHGEPFRLYIDGDQIQERVREMGAEISRDYNGRTPILIGVLNGAFVFTADLMRAMEIDCEVDFLKLSSYGAEKVTTGQVHQLKRIDADIEDRHIIIVEDIVDTGHSMRFIVDAMTKYNPASVAVATFLHKREATVVDLELDYVGFEIPNKFVVGYGLDYGQVGRNLAGIYIEDPD